MNRDKNAGRDDERELLGAALLAQTGRARGARPSMAELAAWADGKLDGERLAEVETHIAHDPGVFTSAMEVRRLREQASRTDRRGRAGTVRWFGAALGAAAAVVLALTVFIGPDEPGAPPTEAPEPVLRSASLDHPDWRVAAFRSGYARQADANAFELADAIVTIDRCMDGDDCARLARELTAFGGALAQIDRRCAAGTLDDDAAVEAAARIRRIDAAVAGSLELTAWRGHLQGLSQALQAGPEAACTAGAELKTLLMTD